MMNDGWGLDWRMPMTMMSLVVEVGWGEQRGVSSGSGGRGRERGERGRTGSSRT